MKSLANKYYRWILLFVAAGMVSFLAGCGTVADDADHVSSRPWNTPKSWEGGLPTSINEGR